MLAACYHVIVDPSSAEESNLTMSLVLWKADPNVHHYNAEDSCVKSSRSVSRMQRSLVV